MQTAKKGDLTATALVEDGMLEAEIMHPVALDSEMPRDTESDTKDLMRSVALRSYVTFA